MKSLVFAAMRHYNQIRNRLLNKFNAPIIVLMYHRVCEAQDSTSPYFVSPANFQDQMRYVKQHFDVLRFEDDWSHVDKPSCVITFDDGYFDNYVVARDFLEKEAIPATFFISTQNIGTNNLFWWDELALNQVFLEKQTGKSVNALFKQLKNSKHAGQVDFFNAYRPLFPSQASASKSYRSMSEQELLSLAKLKHTTVGVHTINHPKLTLLNRDQMFFELNESKNTIEKITGVPATTCSFPYGSYNQTTIDVCSSIGFQKAATGVSHNSYCWTNPLKTPRISVFNDEINVFKQKIQRLMH